MIYSIKLFFAVALPMLVFDAVWLNLMNKPFYAHHLGGIMAKDPIWIAAGIFYVLYAIGVAFFVVSPALSQAIPWWHVLLRGALFGLVAYATYDLTNQATTAGWPVIITVVDLIWGACITGITSLVAYLILK